MWCRKIWKHLGIGDLLPQVDSMTYLLSSFPWWRYFTLSFRCKTPGCPVSITQFLLQSRRGSSQWQPKAFSSESQFWKRWYLDTPQSFHRRVCCRLSKPRCLGPRFPDDWANLQRSLFRTIISIQPPTILFLQNCLTNITKEKQWVRS